MDPGQVSWETLASLLVLQAVSPHCVSALHQAVRPGWARQALLLVETGWELRLSRPSPGQGFAPCSRAH